MQDTRELEVRLRKNQDTLKMVGLGVIAFGIWSVIKAVLYFTLHQEALMQDITGPSAEVDERILTAVFYVTLVFLLAVDLGIRLLIGLSAIAEGRGRKKRSVYLIIALLYAGISIIGLVVSFAGDLSAFDSLMDVAVTAIVEITAILTMLEMCVSAIRVRKLRKQLNVQE